MNKDKRILYVISLINLAVLLSLFFVDVGNSKIVAACALLPLAIVTRCLVRKRSAHSINVKEVLMLSILFGAVYVLLIQLSGVIFGYYKNPYFVNYELFLTAILPLAIIIISVEIVRVTLLDQKNAFVSVITFLACVTAEVLMFSNLAGITSFNKFMDLVGLNLLPAISANLFYHYSSKRYGAIPNTVFRMIITLYVYFVLQTPDITDVLMVLCKIFLPLIMLFSFISLYEKKKRMALKNKRGKIITVGNLIFVTVVVLVSMLISCQFQYGAIVIATGSMTGEINKGDVIIYERYEDQTIKEGQVIVYRDQTTRIVHRVIEIQNIGGEIRYFTKGDANRDPDLGYRTESDIVGLTDLKVAYVGYPTLWLRELIDNFSE